MKTETPTDKKQNNGQKHLQTLKHKGMKPNKTNK